jgi:hypothetical protein
LLSKGIGFIAPPPGISVRCGILRMLPNVDVAVDLSADVAGPVIAKAGKEGFAKLADSPLRLLALANHRSSCTG